MTAAASVPTVLPEAEPSQVITISDIDPDEPGKKVKRFTPLADLAKGLGGVVIARDIEEMARFLSDGTVDVYMGSPFPSLAVQEISGSEFILRRWKGGAPNYWSTFVAQKGNGVSKVEDLLGTVLAFEQHQSTSGYLLPAATLMRRGLALKEVSGPGAVVAPDEIGYILSGDEQNTFELVRQGRVEGGAVSNQATTSCRRSGPRRSAPLTAR